MNVIFFLHYPDRRGAGLFFATFPLFQHLIKECDDISMFSSSFSLKRVDDLTVWSEKNLNDKGRWVKSLGKKMFREKSLIHVHGLWGLHSFLAYLSCVFFGSEVVVSPHGMMDPWAMKNSSLKKFLARKIYEERLWANASCFHALNKKESEEIKKIVPSARVVIIPNGVDSPNFVRREINRVKRLLFLGRLDKKKGIYELLDAWQVWGKSPSNIELHVAGSGDSYIEKKLNLLDKTGVLRYHGEVYGHEKDKLFKSCDAFILPSFSEGLPMTVLEALSYGMTAFISPNCNMVDELKQNLVFEVSPNTNSLIDSFNLLSGLTDQFMIKHARYVESYVKENYSWESVAKKHAENYERLSGGYS